MSPPKVTTRDDASKGKLLLWILLVNHKVFLNSTRMIRLIIALSLTALEPSDPGMYCQDVSLQTFFLERTVITFVASKPVLALCCMLSLTMKPERSWMKCRERAFVTNQVLLFSMNCFYVTF